MKEKWQIQHLEAEANDDSTLIYRLPVSVTVSEPFNEIHRESYFKIPKSLEQYTI